MWSPRTRSGLNSGVASSGTPPRAGCNACRLWRRESKEPPPQTEVGCRRSARGKGPEGPWAGPTAPKLWAQGIGRARKSAPVPTWRCGSGAFPGWCQDLGRCRLHWGGGMPRVGGGGFPLRLAYSTKVGPSTRARRAQVDPFVFLAVLAAAACHAGWNTLLKLKVAPVVATVLVAGAAGLVGLPLLPFTPLPAAPARPYIVASAIIHVAYFVTLAEAYRWGDL